MQRKLASCVDELRPNMHDTKFTAVELTDFTVLNQMVPHAGGCTALGKLETYRYQHQSIPMGSTQRLQQRSSSHDCQGHGWTINPATPIFCVRTRYISPATQHQRCRLSA
jgi:hypothetical protein